jgi:small-conductance mechanosensitive channel
MRYLDKRDENDIILPNIIKYCRKPTLMFFIIIAIRIVFPMLVQGDLIDISRIDPAKLESAISHETLTGTELFKTGSPLEIIVMRIIVISLIVCTAWLLYSVVLVVDAVILSQYDIKAEDNLEARRVQTQLNVLKRIGQLVIIVIAFSAIIMTFERVRLLGTSLLASAGIIGIVVGIAAQKTIGTFIAGLQIAFTQPIRIDDVVIVENEWGWIEEVTLTYVVVRIWDQRRLIVPITYFIEKPFQNWTRTTAELLGTVFLYVDYTVPLEAIRQELKHIAESTPLWDKRVCLLQVTSCTERTVEIRALVSAAGSGKAWDLRCLVREKLIEFIQNNYPAALPRMRAELDRLDLSKLD